MTGTVVVVYAVLAVSVLAVWLGYLHHYGAREDRRYVRDGHGRRPLR